MAIDLNKCLTLGDYIEAAIGIYEERCKALTIEQAFSEGKRLQRMCNSEWMDSAKAAKEDAEMLAI